MAVLPAGKKSGRNNKVTVNFTEVAIWRGSIVYWYHSVLGLKRHKLLFMLIL